MERNTSDIELKVNMVFQECNQYQDEVSTAYTPARQV